MTVRLGSISFDEEVIKRQLSRDLGDDWFPDPRRFEDMLASEHVKEVLEQNFETHDGVFQPSLATLRNIPKSNFTLRYGLETSLAERALYHALVSRLVPIYDQLVPWSVFSYRSTADNRYMFRRAVEAWKDFTGVVKTALPEKGVLLSTDLANFYEHIEVDRLRDTFLELLPELTISAEEKADVRAHVGALVEYLRTWCYSRRGGLPQNRDASSFLANVFLIPVDRAMLSLGYQYFRYMDDIKVVCSSAYHARKALKVLSLELRKHGAVVNAGKTKIVLATDAVEINACLDDGEPMLQQIDSIWQTRSMRPISRSFPLLSELTQRLIRAGKVDSRPFRFCIKRLELLAACPEFQVPAAYFAPITPLVISALAENPASTDQLARYLRTVPTSEVDLRRLHDHLTGEACNVYTWQTYHLWALMVHKRYKSDSLLSHAMDVVRRQPDNAARSGATLYAGACGERKERIEIAERFRALTSFMGQRTALLAIQELHFAPHVKENVVPWLRADLKFVFKGLNRSGLYVAPLQRQSITRFVDADRDYE